MHGNHHNHIIDQYAYDTSYTIEGTTKTLGNLVNVLKTFSLASGLDINWSKFATYWQSLTSDKSHGYVHFIGTGPKRENFLNY